MSGSGDKVVAGLVELIYSAVEEPTRWEHFLEVFANAIHTKRAYFWISRMNPMRPLVSASFGSTPQIIALLNQPGFRDPWFSRVDVATVGEGAILRSNEICPDEEVVADPSYQVLQQVSDDHYGGGVLLVRSEAASSGMSTIRPRGAGPLTDEELATWRALIPHLQAAVRLITRHARISLERDAMMRYFDHLGHGVILASASGSICTANAGASAILEQGRAIRNLSGSVVAAHPLPGRRLAEALLQTGSTVPVADAVWISLHGPGEPPLLATVLPVRTEGEANVAADVPTAAIYLSDASGRPFARSEPLREMFGFTSAEARLACQLASGYSVAEVAERQGLTTSTVRTHLKRALAKAGVNRQAELVALVLNVSPALSDPSRTV